MNTSERLYKIANDYIRLNPGADRGIMALVTGLGDLAALTSPKAAREGARALCSLLCGRMMDGRARGGDEGLAMALDRLADEGGI